MQTHNSNGTPVHSCRDGFFFRVLLLVVLAGVSACGGSGGSSSPPRPGATAPSALSYSSPVEAVVGIEITALTPTVTGTVDSYSVSPELPAGLALSSSTGAITGTPTTATAEATYTITATNAGGSATFGIVITVNPAAPASLSYTSPVTLTAGEAMTPLVPTVTGEVSTYAVNPELPTGLTLDATTGEISGTPTAATAQATHTITASNVSGSTSFEWVLTVEPPPELAVGVFRDGTVEGLGYSSGAQEGLTNARGEFSYEVGEAVAFFVGAVELGTAPLGKPLIMPQDLVASGSAESPEVLNRVRFLMMLDDDANAANNIVISSELRTVAAGWPDVDFSLSEQAFADSIAPLVAQALATGGTHVLPTFAAAGAHLRSTYFCAHSGLYIGEYNKVVPTEGSDAFAILAMPDDISGAAVGFYLRNPGPPVGVDWLLNGLPGFSPALDGTYMHSADFGIGEFILSAEWIDVDNIVGTFQVPVPSAPAYAGTFGVTRARPTSTATHRFVGYAQGGSIDGVFIGTVGRLELEFNLHPTEPAAVTGTLFKVHTNEALPIEGTASGTTLTATAGDSVEINATYDPSQLSYRLEGTVTYDGSTFAFGAQECLLNAPE